jgi:hypothetical protein
MLASKGIIMKMPSHTLAIPLVEREEISKRGKSGAVIAGGGGGGERTT